MSGTPPSLTVTIIRRELLTGLRSWKSFLLLLAILSVLYGTAYFAMDVASSNYVFMAGVMRSLFTVQVFAVGCIVYAILPAMAAVSINGERQEENYDLLLTTLISPRRIILGKYIAVLIRALLVTIAVLPFTGLVYFYAGVDVESFLGALAILMPAALCNAAVGIWCSNFITQPARAVFLTFALITVLAGLIPLSAFVYSEFPYLHSVEPLASLSSAMASAPLAAYAIYQLLAGAAFLLGALYSLRRLLTLPQPVRSRIENAALAELAAKRLFHRPFRPIPDGANPLGYKDLCGSALHSRAAAVAAFVLTATAYGLLVVWIVRGDTGALVAIGALERVAIVILVPPMVAVLVVRERDAIAFDMLRMSLLGAVDLVAGKIAVLPRLLSPVIFAIALCKTLVVVAVLTLFTNQDYGPPNYFYVLDWLLLPLHFFFVTLASMLGAALPRKLIPAIGGAFGATLFSIFLLCYMQFHILASNTSNEAEPVTMFLISHVFILGIAYIVLLGLTMAIVSSVWCPVESASHAGQSPQAQPTNLPK